MPAKGKLGGHCGKTRSAVNASDVKRAKIDRVCIELRDAGYTLQEIAEQVQLMAEFARPKFNRMEAKRACDRAIACYHEETGLLAEHTRERMIERTRRICARHVVRAMNGDAKSAEMVLKYDGRLCELLGIRLFRQTTVELSGPGGGPIQAQQVVTLERLTYDERMRIVDRMTGDVGPPEEGFFRGEPDWPASARLGG